MKHSTWSFIGPVVILVIFAISLLPPSQAQGETNLEVFADNDYFVVLNTGNEPADLSRLSFHFPHTALILTSIATPPQGNCIAPGWCYAFVVDDTTPVLPFECKQSTIFMTSVNEHSAFWLSDGIFNGYRVYHIDQAETPSGIAQCGNVSSCEFSVPPAAMESCDIVKRSEPNGSELETAGLSPDFPPWMIPTIMAITLGGIGILVWNVVKGVTDQNGLGRDSTNGGIVYNTSKGKPVNRKYKVFVSYAHEDRELKNSLITGFAALKREGFVEIWHDEEILPAQEWHEEIANKLESADIILLLISPDFIASDFIYDVELKSAMKRHEEKTAHVVPVILRPADWHSQIYGKLQALPTGGIEVTSDKWRNQDEAILNIVQGIRRLVM